MPRCLFKNNGTPTTKPGTESDQKRIALSRWITAMLVYHGDEQPGEYQTPGANGYSAAELARAKHHYPADTKPSRKAREGKHRKSYSAMWEQPPVAPTPPPPEPPKRKYRSLRGEIAVKNHLTKKKP